MSFPSLAFWHSTVPESVLRHLIGLEPQRDGGQRVLEALHNASDDLLSASFVLDAYLPSQPNLLCAVLLLCVLGVLCLLALLITLFLFVSSPSCHGCSTTHSSAVSASDEAFSSENGKRLPGMRHCRLRRLLLFCVCVPLWLCLLCGSALFCTSLADAFAPNPVQLAPLTAAAVELNGPEQWPGEGGRTEMEGRDGDQRDMLRKFEDIRELGFQFQSLFSPSGVARFLLVFLLTAYLCALLCSLLTSLVGLNQRLRNYRPTIDYHAKTGAGGGMSRIHRLLAGLGICLLGAAPLMVSIGTLLMVQAHGHTNLCAQEQRMVQDAAIENYVHSHFISSKSNPITSASTEALLPDFLRDLEAERDALNRENCAVDLLPLNGIWVAVLLLGLASAPFGLGVIGLLATSACGPVVEESVSLRAYVPGWLQNSALTPDAYSSIPELSGTAYSMGGTSVMSSSGRHPSPISQSSFGTFVYKKY